MIHWNIFIEIEKIVSNVIEKNDLITVYLF